MSFLRVGGFFETQGRDMYGLGYRYKLDLLPTLFLLPHNNYGGVTYGDEVLSNTELNFDFMFGSDNKDDEFLRVGASLYSSLFNVFPENYRFHNLSPYFSMGPGLSWFEGKKIGEKKETFHSEFCAGAFLEGGLAFTGYHKSKFPFVMIRIEGNALFPEKVFEFRLGIFIDVGVFFDIFIYTGDSWIE